MTNRYYDGLIQPVPFCTYLFSLSLSHSNLSSHLAIITFIFSTTRIFPSIKSRQNPEIETKLTHTFWAQMPRESSQKSYQFKTFGRLHICRPHLVAFSRTSAPLFPDPAAPPPPPKPCPPPPAALARDVCCIRARSSIASARDRCLKKMGAMILGQWYVHVFNFLTWTCRGTCMYYVQPLNNLEF